MPENSSKALDVSVFWINRLSYSIHKQAKEKGFYHGESHSVAEKIALIHSEVSEMLEADRKTLQYPDKHCPDFLNIEIECADAIIRLLDLAAWQGWDIGKAIQAKHEYNSTREPKHGKRY